MAIGPWQILIIAVLVILLFGGRGKISSIMGDMGKGITSFKKGLRDEVADAKNASMDAGNSAIDVTPARDTAAASPDTAKPKTKTPRT